MSFGVSRMMAWEGMSMKAIVVACNIDPGYQTGQDL